jgi:hypothetical protein
MTDMLFCFTAGYYQYTQLQACKARVRVVTASDDDSGYDSDSDNFKATTHWSQQLITVNHAAQLDAHDTQVIEVSIQLPACYSQTDYKVAIVYCCIPYSFTSSQKYL